MHKVNNLNYELFVEIYANAYINGIKLMIEKAFNICRILSVIFFCELSYPHRSSYSFIISHTEELQRFKR